jgi:hypothetical protein
MVHGLQVLTGLELQVKGILPFICLPMQRKLHQG